MNFTLSGDYAAFGILQMLKHRHSESLPQQIAMVLRKRGILGSRQHDEREIHAGQRQKPAQFLIGELQRRIQRNHQDLRSEFLQAGKIRSGKLPNPPVRPEPRFEHRYGAGEREREMEHLA